MLKHVKTVYKLEIEEEKPLNLNMQHFTIDKD